MSCTKSAAITSGRFSFGGTAGGTVRHYWSSIGAPNFVTYCVATVPAEAQVARIAAALNYTQDLTDDQLTEDSAGIVLEDRDLLLDALRTFANLAEYRDIREGMAKVLRPHERDGFLAAMQAARDALGGR